MFESCPGAKSMMAPQIGNIASDVYCSGSNNMKIVASITSLYIDSEYRKYQTIPLIREVVGP